MRPIDVSLVVPVRDEAGNIGPLVAEIRERLDAAGLSWEAFLVDDGSTDGSWNEIVETAAADPRVMGERHDTGLGKSAALMTGFCRCRGRHVAMLDGDGQDDPAEIPRMVRQLDADPAVGLVNGWKTPRLDPWHKTLPSRVFNLLVGCVTGLHLHDHNCGLKAIRGDVARGLQLTTDMHRFIPTLVSLGGHGVVEVPVHHRPRVRGVSKYGVGRFVRGLADLGRVAALLTALPEAGDAAARRRLRWGVYAILAAVALGGIVGRIAAVASVDRLALENRLVDEAVKRAAAAGEAVDAAAVRSRIEREKRLVRPFLSGNDRSRWLTVRALVERGTFAIEDLVVEPGWDSLDAVVHPDHTGTLHLYSSKPPLLAVIAAGPYWLIQRLTGWTLGDHPFEVGRMLQLVCGAVPFAIMLAFTLRAVDAVGSSDWGRLWAAALATTGTLLTTFAVVFTNHLPAAAAAAASLWLTLAIRTGARQSGWSYFAAGLAAALAAAFELPALAWLVAVLVLLARCDLRRTLVSAVPAALLVTVAALGTNFLAHGTIVPPYAHRADRMRPAATATEESWNPDNWYDYAIRLPDGRLLQSYWRSPQGVDRGEPSRAAYAWHALAGHHGMLSLTPAWLLVVPGLALLAARPRRRHAAGDAQLALAIAGVSAVVIAFYLLRPQADRNYGGMTSGFRWVFWMAPLWVAAVVPAADILGRSRSGRVVGCLLLAVSVLSVAYPTWNPWTRPWIEQALRHAGWLAAP